jgi:[ribosomal protein S5]-alanine N-acetyltransferase
MDVWYRSERVMVRRLKRDDIGDEYLSWFHDPAVRSFIKFAKEPPGRDALRQYWSEKNADPKVDFLGLFDGASGSHLGNMKFELGPAPGEAHVGFLIGDPVSRRRGLLRETLPACVDALRRARGPLTVYLTVDPQNRDAVAAFTRLGFRETSTEPNGDLRMDYRAV